MAAVLVISSVSGAVPLVHADGDSSSNSNQGTSGSDNDGDTASSTNSSGSTSSNTPDAPHNATSTSDTGQSGDRPHSTVSAQTNTGVSGTTSETTSSSSDDPSDTKSEPAVTGTLGSLVDSTDPQIPTTLNLDPVVVDLPAPSASGAAPTESESTSGSDTVENSAPAAAQSTSEPTSHVESTSTTSNSATTQDAASSAAPVNAPDTVAATDAAPAANPAATAALASEQPATQTTTPEVRHVIVYLLRMLASSTVDAVIRLATAICDMFSVSWATPAAGAVQSLTALSYNSIVTLLKKILASSSSTKVGSPTPAEALASDFSLDKIITSLTSMLQVAAPALADAWRPFSAKATPAQKAVTALVAMSLWALISAALPGLGGLFAVGATGVRIGYRQAKAGITLRTTELARFAKSGPIGTVCTGSLVSVHSRTAADHTPARPHLRLVS
ncbi:hypothetical protein SAMN04488583_5454 [Mycobacterium sp. 88mf]|nr:hypothetical protein SAMN04488583_5454 [Mycobacterium sp. 88mf]SFG26853.1 hypothetical protein SAMN04488582_10625 [Mycobacterium sp. 455mf]